MQATVTPSRLEPAATLTLPSDARAFVLRPVRDLLGAADVDHALQNVRYAKALGLYDNPEVLGQLNEYERLLLSHI